MKQKVKQQKQLPETIKLDVEERMKILANLIIDRVLEDQKKGTLRFQK